MVFGIIIICFVITLNLVIFSIVKMTKENKELIEKTRYEMKEQQLENLLQIKEGGLKNEIIFDICIKSNGYWGNLTQIEIKIGDYVLVTHNYGVGLSDTELIEIKIDMLNELQKEQFKEADKKATKMKQEKEKYLEKINKIKEN